MRFYLTIVFSIAIILVSEAQSDFKYSKKPNLVVKVDSIGRGGFNSKIKSPLPDYLVKNSDSLLHELISNHKDCLILEDSCLVLKTKNKKERFCKYSPKHFSKSFNDYRLVGKRRDYLIFERSGYEWREYFCFNLRTKGGFYTMNYPLFINENLIFSYGNYYAEGQFEIYDIQKDKYYGFEYYNWELDKLYRINKSFFLRFKSNDSREEKFIKITLGS